jgi:aminoglycoside phosphotransferase (APT) family kinase protein
MESWDEHEPEWRRLGLERPKRLSCLLRTPRFRASSHVLLFLFADDRKTPVLVAKSPRLPNDHAFLDREAANLRALASLPLDAADSVPRVVAYREMRGSRVLLQTVLPGAPMSPAVVRRRPDACVRSVMHWVTELHRCSRAFSGGVGLSMRRAIADTLHPLEAALHESGEAKAMLARTHRLMAPLAASMVPRVVEHGDLSSPNILMDDDGKLGVVDWELADPVGLPAVDVFFFLAYVAFAREDAARTSRHVDAFAKAFFGPRAWARRWVMEYAKQLMLPARALPSLFLLTWVRYVATLLGRLSEADPQANMQQNLMSWLESNRYFALWKYTLEHWEELDLP